VCRWVIAVLVITCFTITFSQYLFETRRDYYLTLGVGFCDEDGFVRWWHSLVTPFVHGTGCPRRYFRRSGFISG